MAGASAGSTGRARPAGVCTPPTRGTSTCPVSGGAGAGPLPEPRLVTAFVDAFRLDPAGAGSSEQPFRPDSPTVCAPRRGRTAAQVVAAHQERCPRGRKDRFDERHPAHARGQTPAEAPDQGTPVYTQLAAEWAARGATVPCRPDPLWQRLASPEHLRHETESTLRQLHLEGNTHPADRTPHLTQPEAPRRAGR
jgi:hypothetical protein